MGRKRQTKSENPKPSKKGKTGGKKLKIITWNVAGFRACVKKGFYEFLKTESPDVICLSEVKCKVGEIPSKPKDYYEYWADCASQAGRHGVGVFSKTQALSVQYDGISDNDGRAITLEYDGFWLVNTYVPNAGQGLKFLDKRKKWDTELRTHLNKLQESKPVIWTGDLNVAYHDYDVYDGETNKKRKKSAGFTPEERKAFGEIIEDDGFIDVYRKFYPDTREEAMTFWSMRAGMRAKKKGWRLDYYVVTPSLMDKIDSCEVRSSQLGSDHAPLVLTLEEPDAGGSDKKKPSRKRKMEEGADAEEEEEEDDSTMKDVEEEKGSSSSSSRKSPKKGKKKMKLQTSDDTEETEDLSWDDLTGGLESSWKEILKAEFKKPYFKTLQANIKKCIKNGEEIFPPREMIYSAFSYTPWEDVKVVIVGQDPYHDNNQAHGLCFSVQKGIKLPGSLRNIYKELKSDIGCTTPKHGYLEKWATQGVLMINTVLTVKPHKANSHKKYGWINFTDSVIKHLGNDRENLVFILWGKQAQAKGKKLIDSSKHLILNHTHPSPLSAHSGFYGSKPFSQTNAYLKKHGKEEIDWELEA